MLMWIAASATAERNSKPANYSHRVTDLAYDSAGVADSPHSGVPTRCASKMTAKRGGENSEGIHEETRIECIYLDGCSVR
jgi:hypothetical protein